MSLVNDEIILQHIKEAREIIEASGGTLVKSRISPEDYFMNLSHEAPNLKYPEVGISKTIVNICELISTILVEDTDEKSSISKIIVMIAEYYFLVSPLLFKDQSARYINDLKFMKHFMRCIQSLCKSRPQAQKEIGNMLVAQDLYNPMKDLDL